MNTEKPETDELLEDVKLGSDSMAAIVLRLSRGYNNEPAGDPVQCLLALATYRLAMAIENVGNNIAIAVDRLDESMKNSGIPYAPMTDD